MPHSEGTITCNLSIMTREKVNGTCGWSMVVYCFFFIHLFCFLFRFAQFILRMDLRMTSTTLNIASCQIQTCCMYSSSSFSCKCHDLFSCQTSLSILTLFVNFLPSLCLSRSPSAIGPVLLCMMSLLCTFTM